MRSIFVVILMCILQADFGYSLLGLKPRSGQQTTTTIPTNSQQQCVCSEHNDRPIYDRPSTHSLNIGNMYYGDCKIYYSQQYHPPNFLPILHYHMVGYVAKDSAVTVQPCPNFVTDIDDKLRTTTSQPPRCNKLALFSDIAKDLNVGTASSVKCPDSHNHSADATIETFCTAPDPTLWIKGINVTENCSNLGHYIPVAVFDHKSTSHQSAGILLACTPASVHIATQNCSYGLHILEITTQDTPKSTQYHVIDWN